MQERLVADAQAIYTAALTGVQPAALLEQVWNEGLDALDRYAHIFVVGAGKASMAMAGQLEKMLGERLSAGLVVVPHGYVATFPGHLQPPERIRVSEAGHPVPDAAGARATREALDLVATAGPNDLVIALISGGGSALWPAPAKGLTLAHMQAVGQALLRCGATIQQVNTVRKHLSRIKGGHLARMAAPATLLALVISDVVGDDLSVIASGPTVPDPTTFAEATQIVQDYEIWKQIPQAVRQHLEDGHAGRIAETPKPGDPIFERVTTHLVGTNRSALQAAAAEAVRRGYAPTIITDSQIGEARRVGAMQALHLLRHGSAKGTCLLWGGETTVTVKGSGRGGRNQELALSAAHTLDGAADAVVLLSGGTDGIDGPTDAAGAWATPATLETARRLGLDAAVHLNNNDAYPFFSALDMLLKPGPTHTNVMDIQIGLVAQ